jgi:hypothetical protein
MKDSYIDTAIVAMFNFKERIIYPEYQFIKLETSVKDEINLIWLIRVH